MPELQNPAVDARESVVVQSKIDEIRAFVDERVSDQPIPEDDAEYEIAKFGLQPGDYVVFVDRKHPFGGGFKRFVSKDDSSETLEGMTFANVGGPYGNFNRSLTNVLLKPNGDLVDRETTENNEGVRVTDESLTASSTDPDEIESYKRYVDVFYSWAKIMMQEPKSPDPDLGPQTSEATDLKKPQARKNGRGLLKLLRLKN